MNVDPLFRRPVIRTAAEAEAMHAQLAESAARTAKCCLLLAASLWSF
jgi:hypothetical protein